MATQVEGPIIRGSTSKASPSVDELLAADSKPLPPALQARGEYEPRSIKVPLSRYSSREFAALEMEHLWKKTWQYACREEDLPNVGDRLPYTVGTLSFMIVRSGENEFKAFHNSCLHRGTRLCESHASGTTIRCPFHGWAWKPDGSLDSIPSDWDFPSVTRCKEEFSLPEVKLATWGGFIFINPDPNAGPLADVLGVLPEHFASFEPENRFTYAHISRKVHANWKVTMEAFLEAYHVVETHSDSMPFTGDASTRYDIWDDGASHISRLYTPLGVPSPLLGDEASRLMAVQGLAQVMALAAGPGVAPPAVTSAEEGRAQVAEWRRQTMGAALNRDLSAVTDAELVDTIQYFMFPNFCPWFGEGLPLVYQFLPLGDDPDWSVMNIRLTAPIPGGAPRPPSAPIIEIGPDESFNDKAPNLGILSHIFDQDMGNLPMVQGGLKRDDHDHEVGKLGQVQRGLKSASHQYAILGRYQECRIAHFHEVLGKVLKVVEGQ